MKPSKNTRIAIIGLGYVGWPLAQEFSKKYSVLGIDNDPVKIKNLNENLKRKSPKTAQNLRCTTRYKEAQHCNYFIVTVPTPIDPYKNPDLTPLIEASTAIGKILKKDDIVIYESTVYPGCTEEVCVPILEKESGMKYNTDFFCGYSPERINPGDTQHTLTNTLKITSGSNPQIAQKINALYLTIIKAGTYLTSSIKIAEAAKVIENTQRDINISFMNELAIIFDKMNLDTTDVLQAAATKWNFLNFKPGLVGGHCISVDPYYLAHKAQSLGYHPQVILSGRRVNDEVPKFVAHKLIKLMLKNGHNLKSAKVLILGLTFKENWSDIRNSKVFDLIQELKEFHVEVDVFDPHVTQNQLPIQSNIQLVHKLSQYEGIVLAVAHDDFLKLNFNQLKSSPKSVIFDIKAVLNPQLVNARL